VGLVLAVGLPALAGENHRRGHNGPPPPPPPDAGKRGPAQANEDDPTDEELLADRPGLPKLTPEEREMLRERLKELRQLPPQARLRIRKNLAIWRQLKPEERGQLRQRFQWLQQLPPEKLRRIQEMSERWRKMTPEERAKLREKFRQGCPGGAPPFLPPLPEEPEPKK